NGLSGRGLQQRQKEGGIGRAARVLVLCILDNADDFIVATVACVRHSEALADGILVGKEPLREGLIDDGNVWGSGCVPLVNDASVQQTRAHGLEIRRANAV